MSVQQHHDFEHWNHAVHAVCGRFVTQPQSPGQRFVGRIQHQNLGGLNVADIQVAAASIRREPGKIGRADDRFYFLVMQRQGSMFVEHTQHPFSLAPGEIALMDSAQAYEMKPQGLIQQLSIHLCRDAVERLLPAGISRFGKLEQTSLSARLLHGMLQQISDGAWTPEAQQHGAALQDALISLLQPALPVDELERLSSPLRRLAERLIDEHLLDPLSPAELASRLNISIRQLYRQFELDGDSVCRYIQRRRLQSSARELVQDISPITTIAYKWGFTDSAHYSRVFKRHYGMPPKDYRALHLKRNGAH